MMDRNQKTLHVRPAQGPLTWLFPELLALTSCKDRQDDPEILDLDYRGACGRALLEELAKRSYRSVEIEDGPRGHALWSWISQASSGRELEIEKPRHTPPSPADDGAPGKAVKGTVEGLLRHAADLCDAKGTMLIEGAGKEAVEVGKAPFSKEQAEKVYSRWTKNEGDHLWVLPLDPSNDLSERLEESIRTIAEDPALFRNACLIPYFNTEQIGTSKGGTDAAETRLLPSWWGILPGDRWPLRIRQRYLELFRLLHPDRIFLFMALENYALAGVDCYLEGVMDRFGSMAPKREKRASMPLILGICGTDGSGKSSHVAALKDYIAGLGLRVCVHKIYRHGVFHDTVTDLTRQCADNKNLHLWRLQRIIKAFDSVKYFYLTLENELAEHDVVIFDRYVYTHHAAGAGRYHHDPFSRELLSIYPEADRIYLLDVPTNEAIRRIGTRKERTVDENEYMLSRYRHALLGQADRYGFVVLNALDPFEQNKQTILEDAARMIEERGLIGEKK
jgi:thymidylate kinase